MSPSSPRSRALLRATLLALPLAALPLISLGARSAQDPSEGAAASPAGRDDPAPLPPGTAATIDEEVISIDEYKDHLLQIYGYRQLHEMVYQRLLQREAERLGVSPTLEELDAAELEMWHTYLDGRQGGDHAAVTAELAQQGASAESFRANFRLSKERELLQRNLVRAKRAPDEQALRALYDQLHGVDGVRVEVRHIMLSRARIQTELTRAGTPAAEVTPERVGAELAARCEALLEELAAGADFEQLARRESHDPSVNQNGGLIPAYNYRRYGAPLAEIVRATEVGVASGPAITTSAYHLLKVESRVTTEFEAVRAELMQALMDAVPSWEELSSLEGEVRASASVRTR